MGMSHSTTLGYGLVLEDMDEDLVKILGLAAPDDEITEYDLGQIEEAALEEALQKLYPHLRLDMVGNSWSGEMGYLLSARSTYANTDVDSRINQPDPTDQEKEELAAFLLTLPENAREEPGWQTCECVF